MMNWIREIVLMLFLTAATECILMLLWVTAIKFTRKWQSIHYIYWMLRGVVAGYFIMICYMACHRYREYLAAEYDALTFTSQAIERISLVLFAIWIAGILWKLKDLGKAYWNFRRLRRQCFIIPKKEQMIFDKVYQKLGMKHKIKVYQGYGVETPFIAGVYRPCIYIPVKTYQEEELITIFTHELIHAREKDTFWKPFVEMITIIYWFNPLSLSLLREVRRWTEANCDCCCVETGISRKAYFSQILEIGVSQTADNLPGGLTLWSEGGKELKWRVQCMKQYQAKKRSRIFGVFTAAVVLAAGIFSSNAAMAGVRSVYTQILFQTMQGTEDLREDDFIHNTLEGHGNIKDFKGLLVEKDVPRKESVMSDLTNVDWNVKNNVVHKSVEFQAKAKEKISISVSIVPTNKTVEAGIISSNGATTYVRGKEAITHDFVISKSGKYRVYVKNESGSKVRIQGFYRCN